MRVHYSILLALFFLIFNTNIIYADATFTPDQQKELQTTIHNYIVKNPQVLLEAMQSLQKQAQNEMIKQAQFVIDHQTTSLFNAPGSPVAGNPKGNITLIEFFDYQCPYCKRLSPVINQAIKDHPNLRVVYKELPVFGESSNFASQASLASQKQQKYLIFHNALMEAKPPFTNQQVLDIAKSVGLNIEQLQTDMKSKAVLAELKNNMALANTMQLTGTPAFIIAQVKINGEKVGTPSKTIFIPGAVSAAQLQASIKQVQ